MTPIDWTSTHWGQPGMNVHTGTTVDDAHTVSEDRAEDSR